MTQETFIGISDVQEVYQSFKASGVMLAAYIFVYLFALLLVIWNVYSVYRKNQKEGIKDTKKFIDLLEPLFPYLIAISGFPFAISGIEWVFGAMEQNILSIVGYQPQINVFDGWAEEQERMEGLGGIFSMDISMLIGYWGVLVTKPFALLIDNYLFSIVLAGRYVWLIVLEFHAPFAIISLLNKETNEVFKTWVKNLYKCFLLIPGFMIANFFAEGMFLAFFGNDDYNGYVVVFLIALKIYLYKWVAGKINSIV